MTTPSTVLKMLCPPVAVVALCAVAATGCGGVEEAPAAALAPEPAMQQLERIVHERVDSGASKGIVAGMLFPDGSTRVIAYGDGGHGRLVDRETVFEIGSITKTFTGTLLAQAVRNGEVKLDQPVASLLPAAVTVPARGGKQITLEQLATHSSGLPREPIYAAGGVAGTARYTVGDLYRFLGGHVLTSDPGEPYEYSNLGVGLLGHALARRAGRSYEELVRERITAPLGMRSTAIVPTARMARHLATGSDAQGATPAWNSPTLAGGGSVRSTIGDMLRFAAANLDGGGDTLRRAMATAREPHTMHRVGLTWELADHGIVWKNGGTWGQTSFLGLDPKRRTAVVVLSNSHASVDDIGFHALDRARPLTPARREIRVAPALLDAYTGTYAVDGAAVTVTRTARGLSVAIPDQRAARLYPETRTGFRARHDDVRVDFQRSGSGAVIGAVVQTSAQKFTAAKVGGRS